MIWVEEIKERVSESTKANDHIYMIYVLLVCYCMYEIL